MTLSGRIVAEPARLWHDEVLAPQFRFEVEHLLPWYVAVEKVLLLEYVRMGFADPVHAAALAARLTEVLAAGITQDPAGNMSDVAFAVERWVTARWAARHAAARDAVAVIDAAFGKSAS